MEELILVVDDAKFARTVAKKTLLQGGYEHVLEASSAKDALKIFVEKQPDLTLLDITLPDNEDLTLLNNMLEARPDAKIIMNSAIGQKLIIADSIKAGAKDYIIKPFEEKQFLETVTKVLEA